MGKAKSKTDDEIKYMVSCYKTLTELRSADLNLYQVARRRGLLEHLTTIMASKKLKHEEMISWIKSFDSRMDMKDSNCYRYYWALRNGYSKYFPPKKPRNRYAEKNITTVDDVDRQIKYGKKVPGETPEQRYNQLVQKLNMIPNDQYYQLEKYIYNIKFQSWWATDEDIILLQLLYYVHFDVKPTGSPELALNKQYWRLCNLFRIERNKRIRVQEFFKEINS